MDIQKTVLIAISLFLVALFPHEQLYCMQDSVDANSISEASVSSAGGFVWMMGPKSGLAAKDPGFNSLLSRIDQTLATNPYLKGIYIIQHWDLVEPEEGVFQFDRLDQIIALANKHNKPYKLSLCAGIYCPKWMYEKGAVAFYTKGSNPDRIDIYNKIVRIPIPWDQVYMKAYFNVLQKLEERYGNDPHFDAIALTVATFMSPEWHLPSSSEDMKKWSQIPKYEEKLEIAWKQGIRQFAQIFPGQQLILEGSSNPLNKKDLADAVVDMGATEYPGRFTIQINQLMGRADMIDRPYFNKLIFYKQKYGEDIQIGIQNLKGWSHEQIAQEQGTMEMSVYNFLQSGATYWELWHGDGANVETCQKLTDLIEDAQLYGSHILK